MSVFSFVGLQYGDCPLMGGYSEQGTGESFEMIVKNCVTVGSVRRSGYREKVGQRRQHVTNNDEVLMTS